MQHARRHTQQHTQQQSRRHTHARTSAHSTHVAARSTRVSSTSPHAAHTARTQHARTHVSTHVSTQHVRRPHASTHARTQHARQHPPPRPVLKTSFQNQFPHFFQKKHQTANSQPEVCNPFHVRGRRLRFGLCGGVMAVDPVSYTHLTLPTILLV